jgi:hypothetical protein
MTVREDAGHATGNRQPRRLCRGLVLWWLPLAAVVVYVALLVERFGRIATAVYTNSDAASPLVIAECLSARDCGHGPVVLGQISYATTLWFDVLTRWVPFHRTCWEVAPYGLALSSVALLAWAAWRLAGGWAAALTTVIGLSASSIVLYAAIAQAFHETTWFSVCLLAAFLLWVTNGPSVSAFRLGFAVIGVGTVVGANLASDPLLAVVGLVPFALAPLARWSQTRSAADRRVVALAAVTVGLVLLSALAVASAMRAAGFTTAPLPSGGVGLANASAARHHLLLFVNDLVALVNGGSIEHGAPAALLGRSVLATLALAAVVSVVVFGMRSRQLARRKLLGSAAVVHSSFWAISVLALCAAFVLSDIPIGPGTTSARYLVGLVYAVAAVTPLSAARSALPRFLVAGSVTLVCVLACVSLAGNDLVLGRSRAAAVRFGPAVLARLERQGLRHGYAGYWDAATLMWSSGDRVLVAPVTRCHRRPRTLLCPYGLNSARSWYVPRPGRSFVLFDATRDNFRSALAGTGPLGRPQSVTHLGPLELLVYGSDVASRFGHTWTAHGPAGVVGLFAEGGRPRTM